MDLGKAWIALGRDPEEIMTELKEYCSVSDRAEAAERLLQEAERTARVLMGRYHPDANPDDPKTAEKFMRVKRAIDVVRCHTQEFRKRVTDRNQPVIIKMT